MIIQNINNTATWGISNDVSVPPAAADIATKMNVADKTQEVVNQQATYDQLQNAIKSINRALRQSNQHDVEFNIDSATKEITVKLVNSSTGEVIRQIPSETALAIAHAIDQFQSFESRGLLIKQKA